MRVDHSPNAAALLHMSATVARRSSESQAAAADSLPAAGKNDRPAPESLPPAATTGNASHATGLARAIEQLQGNVTKNPQAEGLLHALEGLHERQAGRAVDTLA